MNKATIYIACILVFLAGVVYFADAPERILGTSNALKNNENSVPFSVARGTTTTHYKENGSVNYTFNASRLEHYRDSDAPHTVFTLIEDPELVVFQNDEPWFVRADKGRITAADQHIELWQGVTLNHTSIHGMKTVITTEKLMIDPVNKLANTQEPVRIRAEDAEIEGVGMDADLVAEKLTLLSNVRGLYDPN